MTVTRATLAEMTWRDFLSYPDHGVAWSAEAITTIHAEGDDYASRWGRISTGVVFSRVGAFAEDAAATRHRAEGRTGRVTVERADVLAGIVECC